MSARLPSGKWQRIALLLAALLVVGIRLRLLNMPLERDEGEFGYAGQLMLQGIPPYQLCYNMKMPGIYAAYAGIMALFGQTAPGIRIGLLLVNLAAAALLFCLARRFLHDTGATAAAVSYALMTASPGMLGLSAHATQFVAAAALAGLVLLCQACERKAPARFFWSGFFMGLAFLLKQPGVMFGLFGLAILLGSAARERANWGAHLRRIALYALGGAAPLALTMAILWRAGVFDRFWFWAVDYALLHGSSVPIEGGVLALQLYFHAHADAAIWIAAILGLAALVPREDGRDGKLLLLGLLLFSAAAVSAGFYYSAHYFVMLAPGLALLIGAGAEWLARWRFAAPLALAAVCAAVVGGHWAVFFTLAPPEACRATYGVHPFPESEEIGKYIRDNSKPDDTIAVLGSEPEIMFYARRHSATGYIYMYDLMTQQPFADKMTQEMTNQIAAARPEWMVLVEENTSWAAFVEVKTNSPLGPWAQAYARANYAPAALALVRSPPQYFWSPPTFPRQFSQPFVAVGRRKR